MKAKLTMGSMVYEGELSLTHYHGGNAHSWDFHVRGSSVLFFLKLPRKGLDCIFETKKSAISDALAHGITIEE